MLGNDSEIITLTMTSQDIIESLEFDDVINFLKSLGIDELIIEKKKGIIICPTICHNPLGTKASMKLYWYQDVKRFRCFTDCHEWINIFDLYQRFMELNYEPVDYYAAEDYVKQFVTKKQVHYTPSTHNSILDLTQFQYDANIPPFAAVNPNVLSCFSHYYHPTWLRDGISKEAMDKFHILFSYGQNKIIIPHYDRFGQLIGIRGRTLNQQELDKGQKYMPVYVGNTLYNHALQFNLYGIYEHQEAIKKYHTAVVAEGEKSVLLDETYHPGYGFCVACCGHQLSKYHINLLVDTLHVQEIVLAFDKDFAAGTPEAQQLQEQIRKLGERYSNYATISYIWDYKNLLELKDSPYDKGAETFEYLYRTRIRIR